MDYTTFMVPYKTFSKSQKKIIYVFKYVYINVFALMKDVLLCLETTDTDHHKNFSFIV
jgi:hypothetical protein